MASITRWVLVTADDVEGDHEYEDFSEAEEDAQDRNCAIVERTYEYDDTVLVWTPDGGDTWPPKKGGE